MSEDPSNPMRGSERSSNRTAGQSEISPRESGDSSAIDLALLDQIRVGDQSAMTQIFDRYSPAVYSVALRVLRDPGQAEDIVQEVFLQIWKNSSAYVRDRGSLGAWLVVVARNRAIDHLRRRKPAGSVEDVVLASPVDVASEAERNTLMERVRSVLSGLPIEQQQSMQLAFFEGLSHSEIAERTGEPLGTIKTRIRLALISIRKALTA
jgi:RNA polymerase sigma-70 factor (ECF subfamily)